MIFELDIPASDCRSLGLWSNSRLCNSFPFTAGGNYFGDAGFAGRMGFQIL